MAKSRKKIAKKQKAGKARKASRPRDKRAAGKKSVSKSSKKSARKNGKKSTKKSANKAGKKSTHQLTSTTPKITKPARPKAPRASAPTVASAKGSIQRSKNSFYITTAIAYPNGAPHIGHAYEAIATDALARFQRLDGKDVFFLTGTDEHGLKMIQTADAEKLTPMEVATRNAQRFKEMDQRLNI